MPTHPSTDSEKQQFFLNVTFAALGIGFTVYVYYLWLTKPCWVHGEFFQLSLRYLLKPGEGFFSSCIPHIFNENLGEQGYYRPRLLSFFIEYFDTNVAYTLYKHTSLTGLKLPSFAIAIGGTVAAFVYFWRGIFHNRHWGLGILAGASLLYYDVFLNSSFMVLRGGKMLSTTSSLVCLGLFFRLIRKAPHASFFRYAWISVLLFIMMTVDEQVIAVVTFLFCLTALLRKNVSTVSLKVFGLATVIYFSYHYFWGQLIFNYFTPGGLNPKSHPHQLYHVFRISFSNIFHAIDVIIANFYALGLASIAFLALLVISIRRYIRSENRNRVETILLIALVALPFLIGLAMVASHPPIYRIPFLRYIFYMHAPVALVFCSVIYAMSIAGFKSRMAYYFLAACLILVCISGVIKVDALYTYACSPQNTLNSQSYCGDVSAFEGKQGPNWFD